MKKRKQLKLPSQETIIGWGGKISSLLLLLMGLYILSPALMEQTSAEGIECKPGDTNPLCQTSVSDMRADIQVASAISIALQKSLELDVVPKSNGSFVSGGATLSVATNNPSGYAIYLQASKSEAGKASLVSTDLDNPAKIDPVIGIVTKESFLDVANRNTWGYSLDGENYQEIGRAHV